MTNAWLQPDATVIPIDYATYCAAEVARDAALFLVDQREQYLANRDAGQFDGYPDPDATIGEAILAGTPRPRGPGRRDATCGVRLSRTSSSPMRSSERPDGAWSLATPSQRPAPDDACLDRRPVDGRPGPRSSVGGADCPRVGVHDLPTRRCTPEPGRSRGRPVIDLVSLDAFGPRRSREPGVLGRR